MNYFTEQDIPKVQQYLSNQLTGEEKTAFEQRLAQDSNLQEELEWYKAMFNALEETEDQRLKELLKASDQKKETYSKIKRLNIRRWSIAAGFLLVITVLALIWVYAPKQKPEQDFFEPAKLVEADVTRSIVIDDMDNGNFWVASSNGIYKVTTLYENGKYQEVLSILDTLPASASVLFYQANCLMALNRNSEAIPILKKVETYTNETYSNFAQWYLALAYYKTGNKELAKEYAIKTVQNRGIYENDRVQAQKLLEKLDE